jgi:thiamine biosynthesis lipoprotein
MSGGDGRASFPALGTTAVVACADPARLGLAHAEVQRTVEEFDRSCSRFREDSELNAVNASAGEPVAVGGLLLDAVAAALRAARITDGDVDPTIGQALIALGYDRDFAAIGDRRGARVSIAPVPGWRAVKLDLGAGTIAVPRGVRLDLGATAKALAADRAAQAAHAAAERGVLVSLGGDISIAGAPPDGGWPVRVTDDHRSGVEEPGQWITLRSGGLATSSTTVRRWRAGGGSAHHLLDPATATPAVNVWRTASVAAASCLDANIASTAAIVRGLRAVAWLERQGLPSRLVAADGTVRHLAGWPAAGEDLPLAPGAGGRSCRAPLATPEHA